MHFCSSSRRTSELVRLTCSIRRTGFAVALASLMMSVSALVPVMPLVSASSASAAETPDLIFKKTTAWKFLGPDHKLATYGIDDPDVNGVACHFTVPEKGGIEGWLGVAEEVSDISLACRQIGPVKFKKKFDQGSEVFEERRSMFFKRMRIVRGCDTKRNVLVYVVYSDKLVDGSPKNSTSTVPIMPWGTAGDPPQCKDFLKD